MPETMKSLLTNFIENAGGGDGLFVTPMTDIRVVRSSQKLMPFHNIYRPALCVVAQGAKQITVGDETLTYSEGKALVVSIEIPGVGRVIEASPEKPYIGMIIEFDVGIMREVIDNLDAPPQPTPDGLAVFVEQLSDPLRDCLARIVRLFANPDAVPILYPSIMKEICFWLLTGPNGGEVCKIARTESHTRRIADAIFMLQKDFARPIRVEEMADAARMGLSSFHQHFKSLTSMTPLQYQKQLRLLEARRLLVAEASDVTSAAFQVGYESPSQFSREYARMFGDPPKRHANSLKALGVPL